MLAWFGRSCLFAVLLTIPSLSLAQPARESDRPALPFADGDSILFIGDSITQDGRYVDLVTAYLWAQYPSRDIQVLNAGRGSETVSGITEPVHPFPRPNILDRLETALTIVDPDWVIVCYGMNDGIYHPTEPRIKEAYRVGLQRVISTIAESGARAIVLSPPVFDAEAPAVVKRLQEVKPEEPYGYLRPYENYDETLVALANIARELSRDARVERFIDLHFDMFVFLREAKRENPEFAYGDGVHPPLEGHAAMATGILIGLGEDETQVHKVLAQIADLRPPGAAADALPAADGAKEFRETLFKRGRAINAQLRKATDPNTPDEEVLGLGKQAMQLAEEDRETLRKRAVALSQQAAEAK